MPRFVEEAPAVHIGELKRAGVFEGSAATGLMFSRGWVGIKITHRPGDNFICASFTPQEPTITQRIPLCLAKMRYGARNYFVCPRTGERASILYFVDGALASREGHRLVHQTKSGDPTLASSGRAFHREKRLMGYGPKGPARGANRIQLIESMRENNDYKWVGLHTIAVLDRPQIDTSALTYRVCDPETFGNTTRQGLEAGLKGPSWSEREILDTYMSWPAPSDSAISPRPPLWSDPTQDYIYFRPNLDIRVLISSGAASVGELRATELFWGPDREGGVQRCRLVADLRTEGAAFLRMRIFDSKMEQQTYQRAPFELRRGRWEVRCPRTGRRCLMLYLRDGFFASARGHNLIRDRTALD